jgi:hypothetical protein
MSNPVSGVRHSVAVERFLKQEQKCSTVKEFTFLSPEKLAAAELALHFALGQEERSDG